MGNIIFFIQLIIAVFFIRFHVNHYRLGNNQIVTKLNQFTNPLVLPFNQLIKLKSWDVGALIVGWIIALLTAFFLFRGIAIAFVYGTVILYAYTWLNLVTCALFLVVIGSWLQTKGTQPVMQIALSCTEWIMAPLRRVIPSFAGLDFTPILAFFIINIAKQGLRLILQHMF